MAKFKSELKGFEFQYQPFLKTLDRKIKEQMQEAAKEWVLGVASQVPIYSGMAIGSLLPLARFLKVNIPVNPVAPSRVDEGAALGFFSFDSANMEYTFSFTTDVAHYVFNEVNSNARLKNLKHPTPWRSFDAGREAWNNYINTEFFRNVPNVSEFVKLVNIK
jgi:hypothetical protein